MAYNFKTWWVGAYRGMGNCWIEYGISFIVWAFCTSNTNICFCCCLFQIPTGLPRNLESALQRYGSATYKANVVTSLDANGKVNQTLTYGEFSFRSVVGNLFTLEELNKSCDFCRGPHPQPSKDTHNIHPYYFFLWRPSGPHKNCSWVIGCPPLL